jgi:hypothetical protein
MIRSRWIGMALLLTLFCWPAAADSPSELQRLFPQRASITTENGGLVRLPLPPGVLAACRADLSDLRIFDSSGREIAYLADSARGLDVGVEAKQSFEPEVISVRRDEQTPEHAPPTHHEQYELSVPPPSEAGGWELVIEARASRFVREVTIASIAEQGESELVAGFPLFRLDAQTQRTRIPLGALAGKRLRVTIQGREGGYLEPQFHFESARTFDSLRRVEVPLEILSEKSGDGVSVVELQRPSGIVPDLIEVRTTTGSFRRLVRIWDVQPGRNDARLGAGQLYRLDGPRGVDHRSISLRSASGHTLRVEIENGDSPPLANIGFDAVLSGPVLIFELPKGVREATLYFGGGRAYRPRYDLSGLSLRKRQVLSGDRARAAAEIYDQNALGLALIGSIGANPDFDTTPALAFAMHAGAVIDSRMYAYSRPLSIVPAPEGLSRLRLAPEDVAVARADLGDVRVVDQEGKQWPYLIERNAGKARVELALTEQTRDDDTSIYRLMPAVAPLPLRSIRFDVRAPYFDRPYELLAIDAEGGERAVSRGRLRKDGRRPKPVSISFNAGPIRELELRIEDGDDARLDLGDVSGGLRVADLFLVAREGDYLLLIGHPDAEAPRYELERVRDVVLAVQASPVDSGSLDENPSYSARARLGSGSTVLKNALVWGVLLIAAVVLGGLTLRVARQEPTESNSGKSDPDS